MVYNKFIYYNCFFHVSLLFNNNFKFFVGNIFRILHCLNNVPCSRSSSWIIYFVSSFILSVIKLYNSSLYLKCLNFFFKDLSIDVRFFQLLFFESNFYFTYFSNTKFLDPPTYHFFFFLFILHIIQLSRIFNSLLLVIIIIIFRSINSFFWGNYFLHVLICFWFSLLMSYNLFKCYPRTWNV